MAYALYIAENCHECKKVAESLEELSIEVEKFNVDLGSKKPPIPTFAYPALFKGDILLAYGSDIISYLKSKA